MRVVPSVGSGRYSPGGDMAWLLGVRSYQELRSRMAVCSPNSPGNRATDSAADENTDGIVSGSELVSFVKTRVSKETENEQLPELIGSISRITFARPDENGQ